MALKPDFMIVACWFAGGMNAPKIVLLAVEGLTNCVEFLLANVDSIDRCFDQAISLFEVLFLCLQSKLLLSDPSLFFLEIGF